MTTSNSSLASSTRSGKGERSGGDWDPTYDGFGLGSGPMGDMAAHTPGPRETRPKEVREGGTPTDTPRTRPLPTLHEIHQINLRESD